MSMKIAESMSTVDITLVTVEKVAEATNLAKTMNSVILMKNCVKLAVEEMIFAELMNIVISSRMYV